MRQAALLFSLLLAPAALAQQHAGQPSAGTPRIHEPGNGQPLANVPISNLYPGNVAASPDIQNPLHNDPESVQRGMNNFIAFNCVGCHAPNGGGGMGPSLSDNKWIYGSKPAQIYLTIAQGRPNGMPAWAGMLPSDAIWDLVSYVQSIAEKPSDKLGKTISPTSPSIEQVPAEFVSSPTPWRMTEPFSSGRQPGTKK